MLIEPVLQKGEIAKRRARRPAEPLAGGFAAKRALFCEKIAEWGDYRFARRQKKSIIRWVGVFSATNAPQRNYIRGEDAHYVSIDRRHQLG